MRSDQPTAKEWDNLRRHMPIIHTIGRSSTADRNTILRHATPALVDALATAVRVAHMSGARFAPHHRRRALKMMGRNVSKKTKMGLVAGKNGAQSRGGSFFQDVGRWFTKAGKTIKHGVEAAGGAIKGVVEKAAPAVLDAVAKAAPEMLAKAAMMA